MTSCPSVAQKRQFTAISCHSSARNLSETKSNGLHFLLFQESGSAPFE
jgi:hypothetical protein